VSYQPPVGCPLGPLTLLLNFLKLQHVPPGCLGCRHTDNEPKAGLLRIVAAGGRASESREPGPGGVGAVGVGTRTLSEGGAVGDWSREQVGLKCWL
jgi:hypothetical protein